LKKRGALDKAALIDEIIKLDRARRAAITEVNELKHKRNRVSEEIGNQIERWGHLKKDRGNKRDSGADKTAG